MSVTLDLPMPPSANTMWRKNPRGGMYLSAQYVAWKKACDGNFWVAGWAKGWPHQGIVTPIRTPVDVQIVLDRSKRRGDTDNRIKPCLDWLQRSGIIANDSLVEKVSAEWGEAPEGCRVTISPSKPFSVDLASSKKHREG